MRTSRLVRLLHFPSTKWLRKLPLVFLLAGACRSHSPDGRGPSADGDVARIQGKLTASTSLAEALAGKIQPVVGAPDNLISATIPGEPSVRDDGSASYRVPIWVPTGINGLQPSLAVEYNSAGGAGILGPHWRLSGLSTITHCAKVRAIDNVQTAVKLYDDIFCLDGQRLLRQPNTDVFRPERDTYAKIVGTRDGNGDFVTFKVYQRDGLISSYGRTLASRLHGNPGVFPSGGSRDVAYAYYVDKIEDRYGNSILITYGNTLGADPGSYVQELIPVEISWGSTGDAAGQRSVSLAYEGVPANPQTRWVSGLGIRAAQYLRSLTMSAPNGLGGTPMLKRYKFSYDTKAYPDGPDVITGDRLLTSISECDDVGVCKKPTTIQWEPGSLAFTRAPFTNADDARLTGYGTAEWGGDYSDSYRRILTADLNGDGRDDIIYRAFNSPHHSGDFDCLGWKSRLSTLAPGDTSGIPGLSNPTDLTTVAVNEDPSCDQPADLDPALVSPQHFGPAYAYPGDVIITDLDRDGFPDFIVPFGRGRYTATNNTPYLVGYRALLNKNMQISAPINFLDSNGKAFLDIPNTLMTAMMAVADIDGDGIADIIRPTETPPLHLRAASVAPASGLTAWVADSFNYFDCSNASQCNKSIPDVPWPGGGFSDVATVDLDGDGAAEIIQRDFPCDPAFGLLACSFIGTTASVHSPTMNGTMPMPPSPVPRWFVDLNGDGLLDLVFANSPSTIYTAINTGQGFLTTLSQDLPAGAHLAGLSHGDGGVRVVDFNQDGRQDLLIVDSDSSIVPPGEAQWTGYSMPVLISDGRGQFTVQDSGIPSGKYDPLVTHTLVADMNADGLPDIVNLNTYSGITGYIRQGQAPAMVTTIEEGTGREIVFSYDVAAERPAANGSPPFYTTASSSTCDQDRTRLECLTRARWLTKRLAITGPDIDFATAQTFTYEGGVSDKNGRGFLGFTRRDIYGPRTRHTTITYDPTSRLLAGQRYVYPKAMLPKTVRADVDTWQGSFSHHYSTASNGYTASFRGDGTYATVLSSTDRATYHCPTAAGGTCNGPNQQLSRDVETFLVDTFGNVTNHTAAHQDGAGAVLQLDSESTFFAPNTDSWLISLYDSAQDTTRSSTAGGKTTTRTVNITSDTVHGGISSIEIEPQGDGTTHLTRDFFRDGRGRLQGVREHDVGNDDERWPVSFGYEDADGVDIASVYDAFGYETRIWRHPGLGLVVEVDDPNRLASTQSYDSFGRPLMETKPTGAYVNITYLDGPGPGADYRVAPSGINYRTVHVDSFGREKRRISPIDINISLFELSTYDELGRLMEKDIVSGPEANPTTTINTYVRTYDDLNRMQSECHLDSDGQNVCKTNLYEGLNVTSTDEAGRAIRYSADAMGRPSQQSAVVRGVTSLALFSYGPFGTLAQEKTADQTGQTDFGYDVLGRQVSVTRKGVGTRGIGYNAFGDVVESYKLMNDLTTRVDDVIYDRDHLGRVRSMTGPGIQRTFYWDVSRFSPTPWEPDKIGKLMNVVVGNDYDPETEIQYGYGPNGLLMTKTWFAKDSSSSFQYLGGAVFTYDDIGRLSTLTYPDVWSGPLKIQLGYFGFDGSVSSMTDASNNVAIWAATHWNARGQLDGEYMGMPGGPTLSKSTAFYLPTGLPSRTDLIGPDRFANVETFYDAGGLPSILRSQASVGGTWSSSFTYDNLSRLESWTPVSGGPTVSYTYDDDGNLTQRSWSGETVNYGSTASARTATVVQGGVTARNDTYQFDQWGRIFDTPAVSFTYDALDSVTAVTEKATGRSDVFRLDGFGKKLYRQYGNPFEGPPPSEMFELDDLFEFRNVSGVGAEERCHLRANGKLIGDIVRTSDTGGRTATFYLTDPVGSVVAEGASSGVLTARTRRDPFGNALPTPASPYLPPDPSGADPDGSSRMAYAGHPREAGFGVVDMQARYYSPALGRFISPDSTVARPFDRRDYNPYAYAWDNPTAMSDPSGHSVISIIQYFVSGGSPSYTGTDPESLPHSLQNPSAGYDPGQGGGRQLNAGCGMWGCGTYVPGRPPQAPPPPPPPNPVVREADHVATGSSSSDNVGGGPNVDLRKSGETEGGDDDGISGVRTGALVVDVGEVVWDLFKEKTIVGGLKFLDFAIVGDRLLVETAELPRWLKLGNSMITQSQGLFKLVDNGGEGLRFIGKNVITPFMAGYDGAELVDMISQGREDDAWTSVIRLGGDFVPPLHLMNILTDDFKACIVPINDFATPQKFENTQLSAPWRRDELPVQSLQRELPPEPDVPDYVDPFGS